MWQWLNRIFGRRDRRGLFPYRDGAGRRRWGDPFCLWRGLMHHPTVNFEAVGHLVDLGVEPETTAAMNALAEIFNVARFDPATGRGLTDWQLLDLLCEFQDWMDRVKKNTKHSPTSSGPTEPPPSPSPEPAPETGNSTSP